jgi:hypothetical protein
VVSRGLYLSSKLVVRAVALLPLLTLSWDDLPTYTGLPSMLAYHTPLDMVQRERYDLSVDRQNASDAVVLLP